MLLGRDRGGDVSTSIRFIRTRFLPCGRHKMRLGRGRERDIRRGLLAQPNSFSVFAGPKCELGDLEKAMFQRVAGSCELVLSFRPARNGTWTKVKNGRLEGSSDPENSFSAFCTAQNATWTRFRLTLLNHFRHSDRPKMLLGRGPETDDSMGRMYLRNHFLTSGRPKMLLE